MGRFNAAMLFKFGHLLVMLLALAVFYGFDTHRAVPGFIMFGALVLLIISIIIKQWGPNKQAAALGRTIMTKLDQSPDCPGRGRCHGAMDWCVTCGEVVAAVCDDPECSVHRCGACGLHVSDGADLSHLQPVPFCHGGCAEGEE